ncbi:MAG: response regulator [Chloroflexi bacterium]|nr:response regulator [Chloroflexota bacterium]
MSGDTGRPVSPAFAAHVQDAIVHLYDHAHLQVHPLAQLLGVEPGRESCGRTLHRVLLEAIEDLKPGESVPRSSPPWRKYRCLLLRYLQGLSMPRIAQELGVCARQVRRDHQEALEALVSLLWERHTRLLHAGLSTNSPSGVFVLPSLRSGQALAAVPEPGPSTGRRDGDEVGSASSPLSPGGPVSGTAARGKGAPRDAHAGQGAGASGVNGSSLEAEVARMSAAWPRGPTDVGDVVAGAVATTARLAASKGLLLRAAAPSPLPTVDVNAGALRQALVSVLTLAIASVPGGEIEVSACLAGPDALELQVDAHRGQAVGLPPLSASERAGPHPLAAVPEPDPLTERGAESEVRPQGHEQSRWAVRGSNGNLDVSQRLLEAQGAILKVQADGPDRLSVHIRLPLAQHITVLVVDDNPDVVRLIRRYLGGSHFRVVEVTEPSEALSRALECHPQAITLDVMMPSQDGWDLLQKLKNNEETQDIPVIVCSVLKESDLALSLGAADFLAKPLTQQRLLAALDRCLAPTGSPGSSSGSASTLPRSARLRG